MRTAWSALFVPVLMIGLVGCDATIELTKAPFDATSDISDGVFAATSEFTQPTQQLTSSTTPGALGSGSAKARKQLETFAAYSYENVRADIARGNGEYLVSLATLAGVPTESQEAFRTKIQRDYATIYEPSLSRRDAWTKVVNTAWSAGHGRESSPEQH